MQGIEIHRVAFDVYVCHVWCNCGEHFDAKLTEKRDIPCPKCGARYSVLPSIVDGE